MLCQSGRAQTPGIGELTRGFRIGPVQAMYISPFSTGAVWDDGVDMWGGAFHQSAAFTCNIVAAKVVQCVKAPVYTSGLPTGVGQWASNSTFISYGDMSLLTGLQGSVTGYPGGQSFPFSGGSGYSPANSTITETATCTLTSGGTQPRFDVTTSGGVTWMSTLSDEHELSHASAWAGHPNQMHGAPDWLHRRLWGVDHQHPARPARGPRRGHDLQYRHE